MCYTVPLHLPFLKKKYSVYCLTLHLWSSNSTLYFISLKYYHYQRDFLILICSNNAAFLTAFLYRFQKSSNNSIFYTKFNQWVNTHLLNYYYIQNNILFQTGRTPKSWYFTFKVHVCLAHSRYSNICKWKNKLRAIKNNLDLSVIPKC